MSLYFCQDSIICLQQ
uniref:Uncharacterized protein n=1 Tax=Arundo donax TaxID=35708 RepID=A0A0A9MHB1_ARUDO